MTTQGGDVEFVPKAYNMHYKTNTSTTGLSYDSSLIFSHVLEGGGLLICRSWAGKQNGGGMRRGSGFKGGGGNVAEWRG